MRVTLRLMGPVRLLGPQGEDLTPRGQKARGVLALLGTASECRMQRSHLQDRLWSESAPQHGANSLRQTLHELRQTLGPDHRAALARGPGWVGLDPQRVQVDLSPVLDAVGQPQEFAADLDIPDPEFEDWLRDMRLHLEDAPAPVPVAPPPPERLRLVVADLEGAAPQAAVLAAMVVHDAVGRASDLLPVDVQHVARLPEGGTGLGLGGMYSAAGDRVMLLLMLRDLATGRPLWTQNLVLPLDAGAPVMRRAVASVIIGLLDGAQKLPGPVPTMPLRDVFSHSRDRLLAADQQMAQFPALAESATGLSLRAHLRYTMVIERKAGDPQTRLDEANAFAARALERAPGNPMALAVASNLHSWRGDTGGAMELARMACRISPDDELAHHALAQALMDAGRDRDAHTALLRASVGPLSILGPANLLLRRSAVQIRLGRFAEAERLAEAALAHAPDNCASLRFLAALRFYRGDEAGAAEALGRLRALEPDFSLELMSEPEYPVTTLRTMGLLGVTRSGL
ncbi:SARP family transcriptional regulator [Rhodobacteraceae bacterium 2376]|uniref:SARP family transcriptional regulator n=1 Tax=Rhabdonatronobacter sediminivivens TaxID=2743469 RepID=A0A7Z0KXZ8_9RHOB|nr:SARP family transcriptional regulator [Rhabdonatronobacter sediminivivens]NYS24785.1 SARP family transcriptional regulator [Rhabdonatronobacter sediminivivens]